MDLKCSQLIHDIHSKILNQSFDEIDICAPVSYTHLTLPTIA